MDKPMLSVGLFLAFSFLLSATSGQFYNTRCTKSEHCNSQQFLQCLNGYCQCDDAHSQVFDHSIQQCVIRPGGKCYFTGKALINGVMKCSRNSVCISGICQCEPGFGIFSSKASLCKPKPTNSISRCNRPEDCDQQKGLGCTNGECRCRNASLTYQEMFGCIDASDSEFVKMMSTLKETEKLLKDNNIDLDNIVDTLEGAESINNAETENANVKKGQPRQLFSDTNPFGTIDTALDLFPSAQNQAGQNSGGLFGGLFRNPSPSYGPPGTNQNSGRNPGTTPATGGYASGPQTPGLGLGLGNLGQLPRLNFPSVTNFLNLFNRFIPFLRRLSMYLNPIRFIQRLLMTFRSAFPGLGQLRLPGLGLGQGQGGYTASGRPSSYRPPGQGAGGATVRPSYGPPSAQAVDSYNQLTPISQDATQNLQQQSPPAAFESISSFQQGFQSSTSNYQNSRPSSSDNGRPPIISLPSQQSQTKYPRQERVSNHFGESSSPFLPEHL